MSSFQEIAHKKIAGVPVLYLGGAFVVVLAVVAWRMKPSTAKPEESPSDGGTPDAELDENGHATLGGNPYAGMSTNGTVVVQPAPPAPEAADDNRPGSNEEWVRQGSEWLVSEKKVNGQAAYVALNKYVSSQSRSYQESGWVDMVIAAKGLPPEPFTATGPTAPPGTTPPASAASSIKIVNLRLINTRKDHVTISWGAIGRPDKYRIFVNGAKNKEVTSRTAVVVGGLKPGTTYTIGVASVRDNAQGPTAYIVVKTTK